MPGIGIGISPIFHRGGIDYSSHWTTQYKAVYDAYTTKPSAAFATAQNTFVKSLVDGGVWAKGDGILITAAHISTNGEALIDWMHPTGTPAILGHGAGGSDPEFVLKEGFSGVVANKSYINTQFNPTTVGSKWSLNSASLILFNSKPGTGGVTSISTGIDQYNSYLATNRAGATRGSLNALNFTSYTRTTNMEITAVLRDGNEVYRYRDKTLLGQETINPVAIPNGFLYGLRGSNDDLTYDDLRIGMLFWGEYLTVSEYECLVDAWNTYYYALSAYEPSYNVVSDTDDLYAHESQILIKQIGGVDYLFVIYVGNQNDGIEWRPHARAKLRVFNLSTYEEVKSMDLFYANLVAGITVPNVAWNVPRIYFYSTGTLRCMFASLNGLYTRDVNISDSDPDNWTAGNISLVQMTMKNGEGDDVTVDVTSANIQTHLEYTLGETNALYNGLMPMFRNGDIVKNGANWLTTLELSGERAGVASNICVLLASADSGNTWSFSTLVAYTTEGRGRLIESSIFRIGTDLHIIARAITAIVNHFKSTDGGGTWVAQDNIVLDGIINSKPAAINYNDGAEKNILAITERKKLIGGVADSRTTLWIGSMAADNSLTENVEIQTLTFAHYPSFCYYEGKMYISYTKALKGTSVAGDRDSIAVAEITL